jgi:peroxiredoxin
MKINRIFDLFLVLSLILVIALGCDKETPVEEENGQQQNEQVKEVEAAKIHPGKEVAEVLVEEGVTASVEEVAEELLSLKEIFSAARWTPILKDWYGKDAPDFTIKDITGKEHKLSDYRGKDVVIIQWATWCPPCRMEVPELKELLAEKGADKIAIFAISNEQSDTVKSFVEQKEITYTVFAGARRMTSPYNLTRALPSAFYIDTKGKIKAVSEGLVPGKEIEAIFKAKN